MQKIDDRFGLNREAKYRFEIEGHLDQKRAAWFEGMEIETGISNSGSPTTIICGKILDQAMLHGMLAKIRDLGLPLLSVSKISSSPEVEK